MSQVTLESIGDNIMNLKKQLEEFFKKNDSSTTIIINVNINVELKKKKLNDLLHEKKEDKEESFNTYFSNDTEMMVDSGDPEDDFLTEVKQGNLLKENSIKEKSLKGFADGDFVIDSDFIDEDQVRYYVTDNNELEENLLLTMLCAAEESYTDTDDNNKHNKNNKH